MKRRIIIDIDFDPNGVDEEDIDRGLDYAVGHLADEGWLTGPTAAEVDSWTYTVEDPELP